MDHQKIINKLQESHKILAECRDLTTKHRELHSMVIASMIRADKAIQILQANFLADKVDECEISQ